MLNFFKKIKTNKVNKTEEPKRNMNFEKMKQESCRQVFDMKEVLLVQIFQTLLEEESLKGVSHEEKRKLSQKIDAVLTAQVNSCVDRINKF